MISTQDLTKVYDTGTIAVDRVTLDVAEGEFVVLLGPTGCGKSTILRMIAGLVRQTSGHIRIDGRVVDDVPVRDRGVAMVFQDLALYPHLTVAENIAFPLRMTRASDASIATRVAEVTSHLGIRDLLHRLPSQLSGGQRQRVATARAIVRHPKAFLLDEPLSNLDAALRAELRAEIGQLARRLGVTTLHVTHDQAEAMTMADRVAVLRRGVLTQTGPPRQVYEDPETVFVAGFLGTPRTNLLQGAVYSEPGRGAIIDLGGQALGFPWVDPRAKFLAAHHTQRVTVALRADALTAVPPDSPGVALRGTVRLVEHLGHEALVHLDTGSVPTVNEVSQLDLPDRDGGQHLAGLIGTTPAIGGAIRHTLARLRPRREEPPATARTRYGFYPAYDPEPGTEVSHGDVVVRVPGDAVPRTGETLALAVDLDRLLLFDRAGNRIRLTGG